MASCYQALARSLAFRSNSVEALAIAQKSLDIALSAHSVRAEGNAYLAFGEVYRHGYSLSDAIPNYEKAIKIAETIGNRDSFLWSALGLADALCLDGEYIRAKRVLERVGSIVKNAASRYPLEHLHWQLSKATLDYIENEIDDSELVGAAEQYDWLGISWPLVYTQNIIDSKVITIAKDM